MIILFLIFIFMGATLVAGICAPLIMLSNKKKLKKMDALIAEYRNADWKTEAPEHVEREKQELKRRLITIKAGIVAYNNDIEAARDKILIL